MRGALLIVGLLSLCGLAHAGYYYPATQAVTYNIAGSSIGGYNNCQAACATNAGPVNGQWNWCPQHMPTGTGNGQYTGICSMAGANCQTFYHWVNHPDQPVTSPCESTTRWSCPDGSTPNASHQCWNTGVDPQCLKDRAEKLGECDLQLSAGLFACSLLAYIPWFGWPEAVVCGGLEWGINLYCKSQVPTC